MPSDIFLNTSFLRKDRADKRKENRTGNQTDLGVPSGAQNNT